MPALVLRDVAVRFGEVTALDGVSIEVDAGERVAILGRSGAGKSTILNVAAGRTTPTGGTVELLGTSWAQGPPSDARRLRSRVAVIHQQLDLVGPLRVIHNVNAGCLGRWSTSKSLRSLVRPIEVAEARHALEPLGLGDRLFERTDRLSGGQRQRVAVARALRQRGELVLADEPVSAVDPAWRRRVLQVLLDDVASRGATLVASLHDSALALLMFDRAIGVADGRLVFDLPADSVEPALVDELYGASVT